MNPPDVESRSSADVTKLLLNLHLFVRFVVHFRPEGGQVMRSHDTRRRAAHPAAFAFRESPR